MANRVRRISTYAPRAGYDIQSYFPDGRLKFIEVKATLGKDTNFEMTHNEWMTAKRLGDSYFVYRVTNINDSPEMFKIQNSSVFLDRKPLVWRMNYSKEVSQRSDELLRTQRKFLQNPLQLETLLQELPREESIFSVRENKIISHNKLYIKWDEGHQVTCFVCFSEDKLMVRVGYKYRNEYVDIGLCIDCFLKLRDLFM